MTRLTEAEILSDPNLRREALRDFCQWLSKVRPGMMYATHWTGWVVSKKGSPMIHKGFAEMRKMLKVRTTTTANKKKKSG